MPILCAKAVGYRKTLIIWGPGKMPFKVMLWTLLALLPVLTAALGATYFISSPNVIRVSVDETVVVNIFGIDEPIPITVELLEYPDNTVIYDSETQHVSQNVPTTFKMSVSPENATRDSNQERNPKYVTLRAVSQSVALPFDERTQLLLSYKAGYTFIQTDKPIYTPNQKDPVYIRVISVDQQMKPLEEKVRVDVITPHGIIVERVEKLPDTGFVSTTFQLPKSPMFGNWTVVAYYGHEMIHNSTIQFLVKEYVLPTYSVKISVNPESYIVEAFETITTLVHGEYVFGNIQTQDRVITVQGYYRIKYSLLGSDGSLEKITAVGMNGTLNEHGQAAHRISVNDILNGRDFDEVLGKRLHIEAFVVESATGAVQSANHSILQFVDSPFVIKWDQTQRYFKGGFPFEFKFDVLYCYGDPAQRLNVRVEYYEDAQVRRNETVRTDFSGQYTFVENPGENVTTLALKVTTAYGRELEEFELTDTNEVDKFDPGNNVHDLLKIRLNKLTNISVSIDVQRIATNGRTNDGENVVLSTYVVAGGKIIQPKSIQNPNALHNYAFQITPDMVPGARIVAFYINSNNYVVADSLWIDVDDICDNPVQIKMQGPGDDAFYLPHMTYTLNITAKNGTKVGLLAVDSAVYLLQDYHRLTKKKVFSRMASYDLGCGPGGGRNTHGIFKNAGINVLTNAALETPERIGLSCDERNRKRRAAGVISYNLQDLLTEYDGNDTLINFCERGQRTIEDWSCRRRADALSNRAKLPFEDPTVQALYKCCLAVSQAGGRSSSGGGVVIPLAKDFDKKKPLIRSDFFESWMFRDGLIEIGGKGFVEHPVKLPSSITTWVLQAVGVSPLPYGICVADSKEITARRKVFLDVSMPYSVMRQEQIYIRATVYYHVAKGNDMEFILQMEGVEGLCSSARPGEVVSERGSISPGSAKAFYFTMIPLETKDFVLTFYLYTVLGNDAVRKTLHVVPEGIPRVEPLSVVLDPAGYIPNTDATNMTASIAIHGRAIQHTRSLSNDARQLERYNKVVTDAVSFEIPADAIPGTVECEVTLIGSIMGPIASAVIDGLDAGDYGSFLQKPRRCGEQTMIYMAPNVYIFNYLKSTGKVPENVERRAIEHMKQGYSREVQNFLIHEGVDEGAFKTFPNTGGNSWLTAFVLRVFCEAKNYISNYNENVICNGMSWLQRQTRADGSFTFATQNVHRGYFMGGVDEPITLTAYVLIAFSECTCSAMDTSMSKTVANATIFLEEKLDEIEQDAHSLAIVTYALALVGSSRANKANRMLKALAKDNQAQNTKFFGPVEGSPLTVETTAYALLAQLALNDESLTYHVVLWLMEQRDHVGNWYSTQDTMVALQALSVYAEQYQDRDTDLICNVTSTFQSDKGFETGWHVRPENALVLSSTHTKVTNGGGTIIIKSAGLGVATLSVNLHYNKASGNDNYCPFEVNVTTANVQPDTLPNAPDGDQPKLKLNTTVCVKSQNKTSMAIINVGMLSGFTPITESLKKVVETTELIQAYEIGDRSVVFYADGLPHGDDVSPLCVAFLAQQDIPVTNVQPMPVKVYDYYFPDRECVAFYRTNGQSPLLELNCNDDRQMCECAATKCTSMSFSLNATTLKLAACASAKNFAYKVNVQNKEEKGSFEVFTMELYPNPLKKGVDQNVAGMDTRKFFKTVNCPEPVMEKGEDYLIIGDSSIPTNGGTEYAHYMNEKFTVIHWPKDVAQFEQLFDDCKRSCKKPGVSKEEVKLCRHTAPNSCRNIHGPQKRIDYFKAINKEFERGCSW